MAVIKEFKAVKISRDHLLGIQDISISEVSYILDEAKNITNADGRTLYSMNKEGDLNFEILRTDSTNMVMGGTSGIEIPYYPVHLWIDKDTPNQKNVSAYVALTGKMLNVEGPLGK